MRLIPLVVVLLAGCPRSETPTSLVDAGIQPRVFKPPPSRVRAVPPHNVHERGIGPYELGASLKKILDTLPEGPRIELFRLGRVADFSLAKSENSGLLVGIQREVGVTFVAAVAEKIAKTEGGVAVGSNMGDAAKELGPPIIDRQVAADPRIRRYRDLPGAVFVGGLSSKREPRVGAIVVDRLKGPSPALAGGDAPAEVKECVIGEKDRERALSIAKLGGPVELAFLCDGDKIKGVVAHGARRVVWMNTDKGKLRRAGSVSTGNIVFAAPIVLPDDGGLHIVAIASQRTVRELRLALEAWRVEGARFTPVASKRIYSLTKNEITWVGGTLAGVEILAEVAAETANSLRVGGLYVERRGERLAMVAPLSGKTVKLKARTAPTVKEPAIDAGPPDEKKDAAKKPPTKKKDAGATRRLRRGPR